MHYPTVDLFFPSLSFSWHRRSEHILYTMLSSGSERGGILNGSVRHDTSFYPRLDYFARKSQDCRCLSPPEMHTVPRRLCYDTVIHPDQIIDPGFAGLDK